MRSDFPPSRRNWDDERIVVQDQPNDMIAHGVTDGEILCHYVNHNIFATNAWVTLKEALRSTGRADELVNFYRQLGAVSLTQRIVKAGVSYADEFDMSDPQFRIEFRSYLRDSIGLPTLLLDSFYRFSERAVTAAKEAFPPGLQRRMRQWSEERHPRCYMCGIGLDFADADVGHRYTCEHIWPRNYGGNTNVDNLLPACKVCNGSRKKDFATWVIPSIHSVAIGMSPSEEGMKSITGELKFALHYRAAQAVAIEERISLKKAFLKIGPWHDVRICDTDDVGDFFNLANHSVGII